MQTHTLSATRENSPGSSAAPSLMIWQTTRQTPCSFPAASHLDFYNLHELYSSHANGEVANSIHMWKKTIIQSNPEVLKLSLIDECESAELNDMNSWKSALYRGLVANFDKVKKYIFGLSVTEQVDSNT